MGGVPRLDLSAIGIDMNDPGTFALSMIAVCAIVWLLLELVLEGQPVSEELLLRTFRQAGVLV